MYSINQEDLYPTTCLPENIFINSINSSFKCSIGNGIFNKPVVDECGHTYCQFCFEKWLKIKKTCPQTNTSLIQQAVYPNLVVKECLDSLPVYCFLKAKGCEWNGVLEQLRDHIEKDCSEVRLWCPHAECNIYVSRNLMMAHMESCNYRLLKCEFCNEFVIQKDMPVKYEAKIS